MNLTVENQTERTGADTPKPGNTRFCVYENQVYIGETVFDQDSILIGKSRKADLVLDCQNIADIHALVELKQGQAVLFNKNIGNGLRLNGLSVKESLLRAEDVIELGPFSIVFKHEVAPARRPLALQPLTPSHPIPTAPEDPPREARLEEKPSEGSPGMAVEPVATGGEWVEDPAGYSILLLNSYPSDRSRKGAIKRFAALFRTQPEKVAKLFDKPQLVLKRNISAQAAQRTKSALEKAGVLCCVVAEGEALPVLDDPSISISALTAAEQKADRPKMKALKEADESVSVPESAEDPVLEIPLQSNAPATDLGSGDDAVDAYAIAAEPESLEDAAAIPSMESVLYVDEDEDDDPWDAPFDLKAKLTDTAADPSSFQKRPLQVQVVQSIGHRVVDTQFLAKGDKYTVRNEAGRFRLLDSRAQGEAYLYLTPAFNGYVREQGRSKTAIGEFLTEETLHNRRKEIYRIELPTKARVVVYDDTCRFDIALTERAPSPDVQVAAREKTLKWHHWGYSSALHLFFILILSIYAYVTGIDNEEKKPHFVKIDIASLQAMEAKKEIKPPPEKKTPPPKPEPVKVAEKVTKPDKKMPPQKVAQASKTTSKKRKRAASAQQTSRHPNAGGGFGEGNIQNRNVNQTGLLSILGKNAVPGPSDAIASVTNIDAVKVPGATEKNFTVGGIKGSLGTAKISVGASGGVVTTKGSKQVLRSAGASGPGTVAALEKGTTGQKSVKGMVTAKMSHSVKIEGGMSREMVKRVIDQHLGEITYCYESALVGNPSISGRVIFEWKILMNGRVGEIRIVASSINSHQIHDCIKDAIKSWQFPKPVGAEVVVSYPFIFDLVAF